MNIEIEPSGSPKERAERELPHGSDSSRKDLLRMQEVKIERPSKKGGAAIPPATSEKAKRLAFEILGTMEGSEVTVRDPEVKFEGRLDDPLFKRAIVHRDATGHVRVAIKVADYYPLYTGYRQREFLVDSDDAMDCLQIRLEEK